MLTDHLGLIVFIAVSSLHIEKLEPAPAQSINLEIDNFSSKYNCYTCSVVAPVSGSLQFLQMCIVASLPSTIENCHH